MTKLEKQYIMFKFFLSMEGVYISDTLNSSISKAFYNALSENINYDNTDAYYLEVLGKAICESENLAKIKMK
jgi:hypothetical protein